MKRRPPSSTSERELIDLLAKGGRVVPLAALAGWRKCGLLPPLSSYGLRQAGRSYYWSESDILRRAEVVFDLLERHVQIDWVLWGLWLRGFSLPAERLRRVWPQCNRARKRWSQTHSAPIKYRPPESVGESALQQLVDTLGQTLPFERHVSKIIDKAVTRLDRPGGPFYGISRAAVWPLLQMAAYAMENSTVLKDADDKRLAEAQQYLQVASAVLEDCSGEPNSWNNWLAESAGPPLALVILALLGAGQRKALDELTEHLQSSRQNSAAKPTVIVVTRQGHKRYQDSPRQKVAIS